MKATPSGRLPISTKSRSARRGEITEFVGKSAPGQSRGQRHQCGSVTGQNCQISWIIQACRGGGTGRRTGLKILGPERGVWVRFPSPAQWNLATRFDLNQRAGLV